MAQRSARKGSGVLALGHNRSAVYEDVVYSYRELFRVVAI